ncbi:MAG: cobalamin biosynthesis protein [Deltaproteobacteria bacterium]|nr:cobalamin biosynthesis protein [Deltaproteobacteria bacterium]
MKGPLHAVSLTRDGAALALRLARALPGTRAYAPSRFAAEGPEGVQAFDEPVAALIARLWPGAGGFLFVMAAGIAVRSVAPLLRDKAEDPAVVVLDQAGRFAVPILSGHLGGANGLAREAARVLGGTPVITTATDVAERPAIEVWARENGFRLGNRRGVVAVNAAWASGDPVGLVYDREAVGAEAFASMAPHLALVTDDLGEARSFEGALVLVTHRDLGPLRPALTLRPPCLYLGVGCRKAADPETVLRGVRAALAARGLSALSAAVVASVDEKAGEPALHELARSLGVPFRTFPAAALAPVAVPTPSARVERAVGTASVSEAAALLASGGGRLLVAKIADRTWTLAVALRPAFPSSRSTES